jgi:DUF971 family protein
MTSALELAQDAFTGHLALEMLDRSLDALVSDLDFEGFALNCFARIRHGRVDMPDTTGRRNWKAPLMTDDPRYRPVGVQAPYGARELTVSWADGHRTRLPHELLRGYCPCAGCQGHSGELRFQEGRNLELREISRVGNYALGLSWGDGHSTGIYTFTYLRGLGDLIEAEGEEAVRARNVLPRIG